MPDFSENTMVSRKSEALIVENSLRRETCSDASTSSEGKSENSSEQYVIVSEADTASTSQVCGVKPNHNKVAPLKRTAEGEMTFPSRKRLKKSCSPSVIAPSASEYVVISETKSAVSKKASTCCPRSICVADSLNQVRRTGVTLKSNITEYKVLDFLGEGSFGKVVKCLNKKTNKIAAVKITRKADFIDESLIWRELMKGKIEKVPIVQLLDLFQYDRKGFLVFELLDQSLHDFLKHHVVPIEGVRRISLDLLEALAYLKALRIIHTDIKLDNVMLVNHRKKPYSVKLIDFGLAIVKTGGHFPTKVQSLRYRAPEVLLRLPYNEGIDMWSVGCIIGAVLTASRLYPAKSEYDVMRLIHAIQGMPPPRMLSGNVRAIRFFGVRKNRKNPCPGSTEYTWRLKTPKEYYNSIGEKSWKTTESPVRRLEDAVELNFHDTVKDRVRTSKDSKLRNLCTDLLKNILMVDPEKRITADKAVKHQFFSKRLL